MRRNNKVEKNKMKLNILNNQYGFNIRFQIFKINFVFKIFSKRNTEHTIGLRNTTEDHKRLVFLDYDKMLLNEHLLPELKYLQNKHRLSDIYLFASSQVEGNYHAICLDKMTAREWMKIINGTNVDQNYKNVPLHADNKSWVLRFIPKNKSEAPKIIKVLKSKHNKRKKSNAHRLFLNYNYDLKIVKDRNFDESKKIDTVMYETFNYL